MVHSIAEHTLTCTQVSSSPVVSLTSPHSKAFSAFSKTTTQTLSWVVLP